MNRTWTPGVAVRAAQVLLAVVLVTTAMGCRDKAPSTDPAADSVPPSRPAPTVRLPTLDGNELAISDFDDEVVVVDFWATWCAPCRQQAVIMEALHEEFAGQPIQFLAISVGEPADVVGRFAADNPFPYPVLVDSGDVLGAELGIIMLPTVMVVDRDGDISYFEAGVSDEETLRNVILDSGGEL